MPVEHGSPDNVGVVKFYVTMTKNRIITKELVRPYSSIQLQGWLLIS